MYQRLHHLMVPEDASPGSGGGAVPPSTPEPQAQGAPAAVSRDELAQMLDGFKNGLFADLRKAGVFGGKKEQEAERPKAKSDQPPPQQQQDVDQAMSRQRAFDRALRGTNLSDDAAAMMERAFRADAPEDVAGWVKTFLGAFGLAGAGGSSPPRQEPSQPPVDGRPPVTDVPAPAGLAPSDVRDPYSLTEDDVAMMIRRDGVRVTGQKLMEAARRAPPRRLRVRR